MHAEHADRELVLFWESAFAQKGIRDGHLRFFGECFRRFVRS